MSSPGFFWGLLLPHHTHLLCHDEIDLHTSLHSISMTLLPSFTFVNCAHFRVTWRDWTPGSLSVSYRYNSWLFRRRDAPLVEWTKSSVGSSMPSQADSSSSERVSCPIHILESPRGMWNLGCGQSWVGRCIANSCTDNPLSSIFVADFPLSAWDHSQISI